MAYGPHYLHATGNQTKQHDFSVVFENAIGIQRKSENHRG